MNLQGLDNLDPRLFLLLIPIIAVELGLIGFAVADLLAGSGGTPSPCGR